MNKTDFDETQGSADDGFTTVRIDKQIALQITIDPVKLFIYFMSN
jgi:hypothetical protein